jgi:hypothetical protein
MGDESRRLRVVDQERLDEATREDPGDVGGSAVVVCKTTTVSVYPTTAAAFYAVTPQTVIGTETEGGGGTIAADAGTFYALNLGSTVPPPGTNVIVTHVGHRWVFRYDS